MIMMMMIIIIIIIIIITVGCVHAGHPKPDLHDYWVADAGTLRCSS